MKKIDLSYFVKISSINASFKFSVVHVFFVEMFFVCLLYQSIMIKIASYISSRCLFENKFVMKFMIHFWHECSNCESDCKKSCNLCRINFTRWQVEQLSTYCFTFLNKFVQKYFLFNNSRIRVCSKCSTYESSWFCLSNSLLKKSNETYHLLF